MDALSSRRSCTYWRGNDPARTNSYKHGNLDADHQHRADFIFRLKFFPPCRPRLMPPRMFHLPVSTGKKRTTHHEYASAQRNTLSAPTSRDRKLETDVCHWLAAGENINVQAYATHTAIDRSVSVAAVYLMNAYELTDCCSPRDGVPVSWTTSYRPVYSDNQT